MKYITTVDGENYEIEVGPEGLVSVDGIPLSVDFYSVADQPVYSMLVDGRSYEASVSGSDQGYEVLLRGRLYLVEVEDERRRRLRQTSGGLEARSGEFHLNAPMPGLIIGVPVEEGQEVQKGQDLVILESMKMQNELKAPRDGTVTRVRVQQGQRVDQNQVLVTLS